MINFKNCLVTENSVYVDVRIKPHVFFENCYINRVVINDVSNFHNTGPNIDNCVYDSGELSGDNKEFRHFISPGLFKKRVKCISDNIYFIYVQTKGIPSIDTPCGHDVEWYSIAIIDYKYICDRSLSYIRDLVDCRCSKPRNFVDFILRFKAFEMCLISKEWERAIEYFKKYFSRDKSCNCKKSCAPSKCHSCGCDG